jgi:hypothetical protein
MEDKSKITNSIISETTETLTKTECKIVISIIKIMAKINTVYTNEIQIMLTVITQ